MFENQISFIKRGLARLKKAKEPGLDSSNPESEVFDEEEWEEVEVKDTEESGEVTASGIELEKVPGVGEDLNRNIAANMGYRNASNWWLLLAMGILALLTVWAAMGGH